MVDSWLMVFFYYYSTTTTTTNTTNTITTTTTTNNNTHVLVRAVWQVETAGGGGNMFQLQAIRLWVILHMDIKTELLQAFITLVLIGGEWSASYVAALIMPVPFARIILSRK
jgi:hypothetical protein